MLFVFTLTFATLVAGHTPRPLAGPSSHQCLHDLVEVCVGKLHGCLLSQHHRTHHQLDLQYVL